MDKQKELDEALINLIDLGLIKMTIDNGKEYFSITPLGKTLVEKELN